jgi:hypothetical protein
MTVDWPPSAASSKRGSWLRASSAPFWIIVACLTAKLYGAVRFAVKEIPDLARKLWRALGAVAAGLS